MERGVVIGGILISASFLLAVMLNRSAMDAAPVPGVSAQVGGAAGDAISMRAADVPAQVMQPAVPDGPGFCAGEAGLNPSRSDQRDDRLGLWGIVNDPGCCVPGAVYCPAKRMEATSGPDWSPGGAELHIAFDPLHPPRDPAHPRPTR